MKLKVPKITDKHLTNILKYFIIILVSFFIISGIIGDIFGFRRKDNNSTILGKDKNLTLIARVLEINPNTGYAKIDFSLINKFYKDSVDGNLKDCTYDLMIFSGGAIIFSDGSLAFENESIYHNDFIKFQSFKTINLGSYGELKYDADPIIIKIDDDPNGSLFPFDRYMLRINFELLDSSGSIIYPSINTKNEDNRFFASNSINNFSFGRKNVQLPNSFMLFLTRPNYISINFILIIIIAIIIVLWSYYSVLSKKSTSGLEILALNITLLLTFPSMRTILVPSNLEYAPIFDFSSTIIWILSILAILTYFLRNYTEKTATNKPAADHVGLRDSK